MFAAVEVAVRTEFEAAFDCIAAEIFLRDADRLP